MIPAEAVEAAATTLLEALKSDATGTSPYVDATYVSEVVIDGRFNIEAAVRAALEAAAPYMFAQALEDYGADGE